MTLTLDRRAEEWKVPRGRKEVERINKWCDSVNFALRIKFLKFPALDSGRTERKTGSLETLAASLQLHSLNICFSNSLAKDGFV